MPDTPLPREPEEPDLSKLIEQLLGDPGNPALAKALEQMGIDRLDPATLGMVTAQLRALFETAPTDGINLALCLDIARKTVAATGDSIVSGPQSRGVLDAVQVAGLWLDPVTNFATQAMGGHAWSRAEWVEATMDTWGQLVAPVADGVNAAVTAAMRRQFDRLGPEELPAIPGLPAGADPAAMMAGLQPMMARMSGSMFGAQIGQAVGALAGEILTATEVGLPLVRGGSVGLIPANIAAFAEGLEIDAAQVQLYLAVREAARVRLFENAAWLGPQLMVAVQAYARDISIDTDAIEAKLATIDPTDPESMQQALSDSLFSPTPSDAQRAALARLETLLALVEGWVDVVSDRATQAHLPQAAALGEAVRRRRASGGPAEHLFSQLVGLQLRPRRLRDAANLFAALENAGGAQARDAAWGHPDVAPTAADLDDPLGYVERHTTGAGSDLDDALAKILADDDERRLREAIEAEGPSDAGPWPEYPNPPAGRRPPASPAPPEPATPDGPSHPESADLDPPRPDGSNSSPEENDPPGTRPGPVTG